MTRDSSSICAVIVSFYPETDALRELVSALSPQVDAMIVVDNTPSEFADAERVFDGAAEDSLRLVRCGTNLGIAAALNIGIEAALREGFDFVLLSDQDSRPAPDMVARLIEVQCKLEEHGIRVGSVNPLYVDGVTGQAFGFQVQRPGRWLYSIASAEEGFPWIEILSGITSGSIYRSDVLRDVGPMREDYFIDYVDTEWFHRARSKGYRLFGTSAAVMAHALGEAAFPVWYFGWRPFTSYSSRRLYYRFRNFVTMLKDRKIPIAWKIRAGWYWLGNAYAYLFFAPNRTQNAKYILTGLWHGLIGRLGRFDG